MLMLTGDAVDYIRQAVEASDLPEDAGLRIAARTDAASPGGFGAELVDAPELDDRIVEFEGARVFLDPVASEQLDDKVLDAQVQGGGIAFGLADQRRA